MAGDLDLTAPWTSYTRSRTQTKHWGDRPDDLRKRFPVVDDPCSRPSFEPPCSEHIEVLLRWPGGRLERIVSRGHVSPPGFWYDQGEHEWVQVITGAARLEVEGTGEVALGPGDRLWLPAHTRHRVTWTDPGFETVWTALFLDPASGRVDVP